ncbi:hypothetical protein AQJ30_24515 [Streptomyces longwoodensis]|uniref:TIGR02680 family protein n=1 Tax=Streptomyces longwoodensis TaxID=68231 RepID=A0A117QM24_9ACTN|nr:TIGR02680 family protein [Streptomyces longwoodensis]KUN35829.1 hypothetical protein AQJ30_24515 [Streptomyces longwoodensis]
MTTLAFPAPRLPADQARSLQLAGGDHPHRWRLHRAGIVNVWYYYDQRFALSGGRLVLRGSNGSGKSRALEMLLPFVLDADRRRMDATGSGKVRLEDLMRAGGQGQANRLGYVWVELARTADDGLQERYLTVGALIRYSHSTSEAKAWYFLTPLRVDHDLALLDTGRIPLSKEGLAQAIGADRLTSSPDTHRDRVRAAVFGLHGDQGRERYAGLLQLLHTLRSPDVGNRIDEGRLPQILSDALPPLSEKAIATAGEELDGLEETRAALARLEAAYGYVSDFLKVYTRYAAGVCLATAERAKEAALDARQADTDANRLESEHTRLVHNHGAAEAEAAELGGYAEELAATVNGVRQSSEYKAARELSERLSTLQALRTVSSTALNTAHAAREEEQRTAQACRETAQDACDAAASAARLASQANDLLARTGLNLSLPAAVHLQMQDPSPIVEAVRTGIDHDPEPVTRPAPARLVPEPDSVLGSVEALGEASRALRATAASRAQQAAARADEARQLASEREKVLRTQDRADDAAQAASAAEETARTRAADRDREAAGLAAAWRTWTAAALTRQLLGDIDWHATALAPLLDDVDALAGEDLEPAQAEQELALLDATAQQAAAPARARHAQQIAELAAQAAQDQLQRQELLAEAEQLRSEQDLPPALPGWLGERPPHAVALWQLLDFKPGVDEKVQAGVEGALLASGLLYGEVTAGGEVRAGDGQLLLSARGPRALRSVRALLAPAETAIDAAVVNAVLDRIALEPGHPTWVSPDGSWGNGPLTGGHRPVAARFIGAAARAAARAARLVEIDGLLQQVQQRAQERSEHHEVLEEASKALEEHLVRAPRSARLATLRLQATAAREQIVACRKEARALAEEAERMQRAWAARHRSHQEICAALGMPEDVDGLLAVRGYALQAQTACSSVDHGAETVTGHLDRYRTALGRLDTVRERRTHAEETAESAWLIWSREAAALAALREALGADPEQVHRRLTEAEAELTRTEERLRHCRSQILTLTGLVASAEEKAQGAREKAVRATTFLAQQAQALHQRLGHPSIAVALAPGTQPPPELRSQDAAADDVLAAVRQVRAAVQQPDSTADATALMRALSLLERNTAGAYDITVTVEDDLHVVELTDATGRRHIADAAADLRERRDRGRGALTQRERTAFHNFVLGGMAEELRRRLKEAEELVKAMNTSLGSITTSHGIGVRIDWKLADAAGEHITHVKQLMRRDITVLRDAETEELINRLKTLVDESYSRDPEAGYATHLRTALDYRTWHVMDAIITGPERDRERKISRRAKLSQGETRFVSYVTLFAAADAYLSSLPDTGSALRLILLDDAFAKVDQRTIGELMALLVRLDLDFVMTGHALWGFFSDVPQMDTYEVRRDEGTAAVTTHVHWDGHTRRLQTVS